MLNLLSSHGRSYDDNRRFSTRVPRILPKTSYAQYTLGRRKTRNLYLSVPTVEYNATLM